MHTNEGWKYMWICWTTLQTSFIFFWGGRSDIKSMDFLFYPTFNILNGPLTKLDMVKMEIQTSVCACMCVTMLTVCQISYYSLGGVVK